MLRKLALAAGTTGIMLLSTPAAHAEAFFIGGEWFWFSLNFKTLIAKLTGKDIKIGTFVSAEVKVLSSDIECANPATGLPNPGKGPAGLTAAGSSPNVKDDDLVKKDRVQGNIYQTTATVIDLVPPETRLTPPPGICKVSGGTEWLPVFWQDGRLPGQCDKAEAPADLQAPICYTELAVFINGTLTYITGLNKGRGVHVDSSLDSWTWVFLPTVFKFNAFLDSDPDTPGGYSNIYGQCSFPVNNEAGAKFPGKPYGLSNPPVNGWAALPAVSYQCVSITAEQYAAP